MWSFFFLQLKARIEEEAVETRTDSAAGAQGWTALRLNVTSLSLSFSHTENRARSVSISSFCSDLFVCFLALPHVSVSGENRQAFDNHIIHGVRLVKGQMQTSQTWICKHHSDVAFSLFLLIFFSLYCCFNLCLSACSWKMIRQLCYIYICSRQKNIEMILFDWMCAISYFVFLETDHQKCLVSSLKRNDLWVWLTVSCLQDQTGSHRPNQTTDQVNAFISNVHRFITKGFF